LVEKAYFEKLISTCVSYILEIYYGNSKKFVPEDTVTICS